MYSFVLMMALSGGVEAPAAHGCHGCSGAYSGCSGASACHSCRGGRRTARHGCHSSRGSRGCHGCQTVYVVVCHGCSATRGCAGGYVPPPPPPPGTGPKKPEPIKKPTEQKESNAPAPAQIIVSLPADAALFIDDTTTLATSAQRIFVTPELEPNKDYYYTLKAEWVRDGERVTASRRVPLRAGQDTQVVFESTNTSVGQ